MSCSPIAGVNGEYVAGEVALLKGSEPEKTCLLVEGPDDEAVYQRFVNSVVCQIIICYGNQNLLAAIEILNQNMSIDGYLGIKDADFDILDDGSSSKLNILLTDGHDLEVMICSSTALDKFVEIRLRGEDKSLVDRIKSELRTKLFEIGSTLGYLRWVVQAHSWSVDIQTFRLLNHLTETCDLPLALCISELNEICSEMNPDAFSLEKLNRITSAYASHLCHGHELMLLLGAIFPKIAKKHLRKKVNSGADVATQLFLAYEYTMFQESKLFNEIQDWEKNNPTYRVLAS